MATKSLRRFEAYRNFAAFWLLGVLNNSAYVVMLALAKEIESGGVGVVYFFDIFPTILVKLTGPYWFHYFPYPIRMWTIAGLMSASYFCVAVGQTPMQKLLGVFFASLQGGLGEASCLAMCSFYDSRKMLTAWSSGTGFAGVAGYCWVAVMHEFLGISSHTLLIITMLSSAGWVLVYFCLLRPPSHFQGDVVDLHNDHDHALGSDADTDKEDVQLLNEGSGSLTLQTSKMSDMSMKERVVRTLVLWPYMVPLMIVYFAEYAMQSGTWASIGFPITDETARRKFYTFANWLYQAGVFISRSSGMIFQANRKVLFLMPMLQSGLLIFFFIDAAAHFWYNYGLLTLCFCAGLLGGAVYVNAFTLLSKEVEFRYREFSLTAASLADSLGVACADIAGILIQGCLYRLNHINGAVFKC